MALSKDKITKHAGSFTTREVHVPAWKDENGDDVVLVRGLTAREWDEHQIATGENSQNASARLVSKGIVDADGSRMFTDADINVIGELPVAEIDRIGDAILRASGLLPDEQKAIEGNSEAAQSGNSGSDSRETSDEPSPS